MKTACEKNVMTQVVRRDSRLGAVGRSGLQSSMLRPDGSDAGVSVSLLH